MTHSIGSLSCSITSGWMNANMSLRTNTVTLASTGFNRLSDRRMDAAL